MIERGTLPGQRTVAAPLGEIAGGARPPRRSARRRSRWSAPSAALREHAALARAAARSPAARWPSRARARRRAGWPRGCARSAPRWWRRPAIRIEPRPVDGELLGGRVALREYALVCLTSPNGVRLLFDALARAGPRRPRARRRHAWRRSARAPPRELRAHGDRRRRGAASARSPRRWSRRSRTCPWTAARAGRARGRGPRRAARRAARARRRGRRAWRCTTRSPSRSTERRRSTRRSARRLRDLHLQLDRALLPRGAAGGVRRAARASCRSAR